MRRCQLWPMARSRLACVAGSDVSRARAPAEKPTSCVPFFYHFAAVDRSFPLPSRACPLVGIRFIYTWVGERDFSSAKPLPPGFKSFARGGVLAALCSDSTRPAIFARDSAAACSGSVYYRIQARPLTLLWGISFSAQMHSLP